MGLPGRAGSVLSKAGSDSHFSGKKSLSLAHWMQGPEVTSGGLEQQIMLFSLTLLYHLAAESL